MVLRVGGLASGMDIDSLVSQMMKAQRAPIDKLFQKKQTLQWQRESYRDFNSKILDFRNNKLFNYRMESTYSTNKVNVTGNAEAISAKSVGTSSGSNMTVLVDRLATAAYASSSDTITLTGDSVVVPTGGTALEFKINGTTVKAEPGETLNQVLTKITQTTNVSAYYDSSAQKVSFMAKNTGEVNGADGKQKQITFEDVTPGNFLSGMLKVSTAAGTGGVNADVTINGIRTTTRTSNTFTVDGVEISLLKTSGGVASSLQIGTDTDKIVETVKNFIKDYNEILKTLTDAVNEPKYRDFPPLTDEQKKDMKDRDIELWEKKAKSGLLRNDEILSKSVQDMRMSIMSIVQTGSTEYNTLSSIGIETGKYQENGKLYLKDEAKLRAAIEANPDAIKKLFAAKGNGDDDLSDVGIAEQMYQSLDDIQKRIMKKVGYASLEDSGSRDESIIGKQLYNLGKQIDAGNDRLARLEDRYYRQFTAMEKAISQYNNQSSYLMNAFGGGQ